MPEPITTLIVATAPLWYEAVTDFIKERIMGAGKDLIETSMEDGVKRGITTAATHIRNPQTTSFTNAFNKACNTFLGEYELDRNLAQAVIKILSYAHDKRLREMNQDVLLATIFTDIPRMAPIEQYCQRAIAFDNLLANSVVTYSQLEIARAVRKFFEELQRELMLTAEWQEIVVAFRSLQLQAKLAGESDLIELEKEYRSYLQERYEYLDLKGFSPRVSGRVISLRLPQIYTDLEFEEGRPNVSSFAEDDLTLISDKRFFELDWQRQLDLLEKRYARLEALKPSTKHLKLFDILNSRKIVVLGEPGSGKTTLARYITYTLASNSYDRIGPELTRLLPILVRVANYGRALEKEPTLHLVDYICNELTPGFGILLKHELEFGRCLVHCKLSF